MPEEREALDRRYREALERAAKRDCGGNVESFERALLQSKAVLAASIVLVEKALADGKGLLSTYYLQVGAETRMPGEDWDAERRLADEALFPGYKEKIRFAALSLDGEGLSNYGDCFLVMRDEKIAQRASVLEDNSLLLAKRHHYVVPRGYRATWQDRAKVAIAKLADQLNADTPPDQFPGILLTRGSTKKSDRFVEVHIWGPMSIRTFSRAVLTRSSGSRVAQRTLRSRLAEQGVALTTKP